MEKGREKDLYMKDSVAVASYLYGTRHDGVSCLTLYLLCVKVGLPKYAVTTGTFNFGTIILHVYKFHISVEKLSPLQFQSHTVLHQSSSLKPPIEYI